MSGALYNAVPNAFDGRNYLEWAQPMQSYLMAQGQWIVITGSRPTPTTDNADAVKDWDDADIKAQGNIRLRLAPSVISAVSSKTTAKEIWTHLESTYGKPGVPAVYQDFHAALSLSIPADSNPVPNLDKLEAHFQRLETNKFAVADHIKGMMLMAKLPSNMDPMIQLYIAGLKPSGTKTAIETITLAGVRQQIILHWEQRQGRQGHPRANANKLSAVKRKGPDPSFRQQQQRPQGQQHQQQQRPQGQQQQHGRPRGQRGGRGRKHQQGAHQHAHFAHMADTITTATITQGPGDMLPQSRNPRTLLHKPVRKTTGNHMYLSLTRALSLAEDLRIQATPEHIRTLEDLVRQLLISTDSLTTSSKTLCDTEIVFSDDLSVSNSQSRIETDSYASRETSPMRSGTAALRFGKIKARSSATTDGEDPLSSDMDEPVPAPKRKRTLKERLDDPMDVMDDAVSLGLTDCEDEVEEFFDRTWYVYRPLHYTESYADCLHPAVTSVASPSLCIVSKRDVPVATPLRLATEDNTCLHHSSYAECARCKGKNRQPTEYNDPDRAWMIDSGASMHFTFCLDDYVDFHYYSTPQPLHTADGVTNMIGEGTVLVPTEFGTTLKLTNVTLVPNLTYKLIS